MFAKTLLLLLGIGIGAYAVFCFKRGMVYMKGYTASREENPGGFYLSLIIYLLFALVLIFFGIFGKVQG